MSIPHYYGDSVRIIFIGGATVMLMSLAFIQKMLGVPLVLSLFAILILVLAAGLTSPYRPISAILNVVVSVIGLFIFEYYAVLGWQQAQVLESSSYLFLFVVNQILTVSFLYSLYLSLKTFRGTMKR